MKRSIFTIVFAFLLVTTLSFTLTSCGGHKTEEVAEAVYACPMHPEVKGKEGDTCNECGMALEKVEEEEGHEDTQH
ncbi:MAG TPA: heavy metal-binding domain-containing protein [Cyclobacteriaceae bacterium]